MIRRRLLHAAAVLTLAATAAACRPGNGASLPPLPALDAMAAPVQQQILEQYERLKAAHASTVSDQDRAREFGTVGELLMAAESVPAAEPFLARAQSLDPSELRWPYYLGHLSRMKGDSAGAIRSFERALVLRPDDVPSLVWLGHLHLDQGEPRLAIPRYEQALRQQPNLFAALFGLGRAAFVSGDYAKAVTALEAAQAGDARATAVNYPLALAYRQVGRVAEAEARLRRRGDAQPPLPDPLMRELAEILQSPVVYEGRGDRALARGDARGAVEAFRRASTLAPERRALKQKLATALAVAGDVSSAVALYQELLAQDPAFAEAHYSLGALLLGSGRPEPAIERFAAAVRADPTYLAARLQLAHTLRRVHAFDRALAAYQAALTLEPRLTEARLGYAITLADAGRYGSARAWLNEGRRLDPDRLELVEVLVRILAAAPDVTARDGATAVGLGEHVVQRSRSWRTLEALAMALAEAGRWDDAVSRQREAISSAQGASPAVAAALAANLRRYERREPCRQPWSVDPL